MANPSVLTVLTFKSSEHLIADGGTQSWVLKRSRAESCTYVVCARHQQGPWKAEGPEAHKHAFLVGRVSAVVPSSETAGRWRVEFSEYAHVDGPRLPLDSASPTQYFDSLAALGIDERALKWQPMVTRRAEAADNAHARISVADIFADAKIMISQRLGLPVENIEITVRA